MSDQRSGAELSAELQSVHDESVRYWASFDTAALIAPIAEGWSPAENVRHLTKSVRAVNTGLKLPKWLIWNRFWRPRRASRGYAELRDIYLARLAAGANAGRFAPDQRPPAADLEAERARIMASHRQSIEEMRGYLPRWSERALDRLQLPHPALGWLTVREMLYFTVYHNRHHPGNVKRKLAARAG